MHHLFVTLLRLHSQILNLILTIWSIIWQWAKSYCNFFCRLSDQCRCQVECLLSTLTSRLANVTQATDLDERDMIRLRDAVTHSADSNASAEVVSEADVLYKRLAAELGVWFALLQILWLADNYQVSAHSLHPSIHLSVCLSMYPVYPHFSHVSGCRSILAIAIPSYSRSHSLLCPSVTSHISIDLHFLHRLDYLRDRFHLVWSDFYRTWTIFPRQNSDYRVKNRPDAIKIRTYA